MRRMFAAATERLSRAVSVRPLLDLVERTIGRRGCLFTFHRAAPTDAWRALPNRNFYLDLGFLDRFLTYLTRRGWAVLSIDEALAHTARRDSTGRFVTFSVDDCYRDTFDLVVPLFRSHGFPVTLYVTTGIPDGTVPLWTAGLEDVLKHNDHVIFENRIVKTHTHHLKRAAFKTISAKWHGPNVANCYTTFCKLHGMDEQAVHWKHAISWEMLELLAKDPLVEIGAHTAAHARISSLSASDAFAELRDSRARLQRKLGVAVRHFAFPYGRSGDCGPRDFAIARATGFASAATTRKGFAFYGQDAHSLPRITINGAHQNIGLMELHLNGVTSAVARMSGRV
jgi:peptidoglycan/xylan/chitin deacetylase (PgdA/CDA1 family)